MKYIIILFLCLSCHQEDKSKDLQNIEKGRKLVAAHGCMNCHDIPSLVGNPENIGPSLKGWSKRKTIAGKLKNNKENLAKWILKTHKIEPNSSMPQLNITKKEARLMSEFLNTL